MFIFVKTKDMLENLFNFPIVMVDGDNEERKNKRADLVGQEEDQELDIIIGEAECPVFDFICVSDRWLPTDQSFQNALSKKFDACFVVFGASGSFIVPWNKAKFKAKLKEFADKLAPIELADGRE